MRYRPAQLERRKAKGQADGSKKGKADTKPDKPEPRLNPKAEVEHETQG
jgi:hypothetical protein